METFGNIAPRLVENGWSPLPLVGKRPKGELLNDWPKWNERLPDSEELSGLISQLGSRTNVGIAVGPWTVVVDIDVKIRDLANDVYRISNNVLGKTPLIRIGMAPKFMLVYRCAPGAVRSQKRHPIEIFSGSGQIVAYGIHPDTKKPYRWVNQSPVDISSVSEEIPLVTEEQVEELFDQVETLGIELPATRTQGDFIDGDAGRVVDGVIGRSFMYAGLLVGRVFESGTKQACICPNHKEHSNKPIGPDTSTVVFGPKGGTQGGFHCLHSHCGEWGPEKVIDWLADNHPDELNRAMDEILTGEGKEEEPTQEKPEPKLNKTTPDKSNALKPTPNPTPPPLAKTVTPGVTVETQAPGDDGKKRKTFNLYEMYNIISNRVKRGDIGIRWSERFSEIQVKFPHSNPDGYAREGGWFAATDNTLVTIWRTVFQGRGAKSNIVDAVANIAHEHPVDDVVEYLESIPQWDNTRRIDNMLCEYFRCDNTPGTREVSRKWMLAAVARAYDPGIRFNFCLVIHGNQQVGKSSGFRALFGEEFYGSLDTNLSNQRAVETVVKQGRWGYEIEEMGSFKKSDVDKTKSFLSTQVDIFVAQYERTATHAPRRFVCCATTNDDKFLSDPTGNKRFWVVHNSGRVDAAGIRRVRDQLWAEARHEWVEWKKEREASSDYLEPDSKLWLSEDANEEFTKNAGEHTMEATWVKHVREILTGASWIERSSLAISLAECGVTRWDSTIVDSMLTPLLSSSGLRKISIDYTADRKRHQFPIWVSRAVRDSEEFKSMSHRDRAAKAKQETARAVTRYQSQVSAVW